MQSARTFAGNLLPPDPWVKRTKKAKMDERKRDQALQLAAQAKDIEELQALFLAAGVKLEVIKLHGHHHEHVYTASMYCSGLKAMLTNREEGKLFFTCDKKVGEEIIFSYTDTRLMLVVWNNTNHRYLDSKRTEWDTHTLALVPISEFDG